MIFNDTKTAVLHDGKTYPLVQLRCNGCLNGAIVGTESLNNIIMNDGNYTSKEAENIDLQIIFYVPDHIIRKPNNEIVKYVNENLS